MYAQSTEVEADAFRWVVVIGAGALSVIALTLLTRPEVGIVWAAILLGFGAGVAWRSSRGRMAETVRPGRGRDGRYRLLVVANETVGGAALRDEISRRCRDRDSEVLVITPALAASRAAHWSSDVDEAIELARQRMELSLIEIGRLGLRAKGEIGDLRPERGDRGRAAEPSPPMRSSSPPTPRAARDGSSTGWSSEPVRTSTCRSPMWWSTSPRRARPGPEDPPTRTSHSFYRYV